VYLIAGCPFAAGWLIRYENITGYRRSKKRSNISWGIAGLSRLNLSPFSIPQLIHVALHNQLNGA